MRKFGRRQSFLAVALVGLFVVGYGFVRSRGGWAELTQMPAKRDDATPAIQNGFELIGIARTTEEDRTPRLYFEDLNLGGSQGPIGSTRLWFRLPPTSRNRISKKSAPPLQAQVRFSNGKAYTAAYEMADIQAGIATLLIPAGHPPVEWADVEVQDLGAKAKARWRIKGLVKTPSALPPEGAAHFEAEGAKVVARAYRKHPVPLNELPKDLESAGAVVEVRLEAPHAKSDGREVHVECERFLPEYLHPTDVRERPNPGTLTPSAEPTFTLALNFPYAYEMKRIGFDGRLEVVELIREPIVFKNVRWEWMKIRGMGLVGQVASDTTPLPDGSIAYVGGSLKEREGALQGYWQRKASAGSLAGPDDSYIDGLVADDQSFDWTAKLLAIRKGKQKPANFTIGTVRGFVVRKRVVRSVPFHLLIPVESAKPTPNPR